MAAWSRRKGTLRIEFKKNPGVIEKRNKENIGGVTDFHSIKAGMPICTQADADLIFASVSSYSVSYQGKLITDTLELNALFYDFDNWQITRADGSPVSKKKIRHEVEQVKIKDIESNWSAKYENYRSSQVTVIEDKILNASSDSVPAFDNEYIMKFYTALDWRGFTSNSQFESAVTKLCHDVMQLGDIDIPEKVCIITLIENANIPYSAPEIMKNIRDQRNILLFDDMSNMKIFDVPLSVSRNFKKAIELGDGYYIRDNECVKLKTVLNVQRGELS